MKRILYFIVIFFSIYTKDVYATGPEWVYRVDTRSPQEIFQNGFTAWGTNDNVQQHISGSSIADHTSAFIATSGTEARNIRTLNILFQNNSIYQGTTLWVYRIRPTNNFWSLNLSMEQGMRSRTAAIRENAEDLYDIYQYQNEWGALNIIAGNQIEQATPYTWNPMGQTSDQRVIAGTVQQNPHYISAAPNANTGTYPFLGNRGILSIANRILTIGHTLLIFATCPGGSRGNNSQTVSTPNSDNYSCDLPLSVSKEQFIDFFSFWQISKADQLYSVPDNLFDNINGVVKIIAVFPHGIRIIPYYLTKYTDGSP